MIQPKPIIIDIVEPVTSPAERIVNVLVGSFGLAGAIAIIGVLVGAVVGGVMLWVRSRKGLGDGS